MKNLHIPSRGLQSNTISIENAELTWLRCRFITDTRIEYGADENEWVADILTGTCDITIEHESSVTSYKDVGGRSTVFDGPPSMVYSPRNTRVCINAKDRPVEILLMSAPARRDTLPRYIPPNAVESRMVGKDNWQRTVYTSIGDNVDADRLIVGETVNPPGNWSSAPPHKHDEYGTNEIPMEEVYFYRFEPTQGFGLQRVYTGHDADAPMDVAYAVKENDFVALPRGYHPVVAAPGYRMIYVWALAGDERKYGAWSDDPDHAWIKQE